MRKAFVAILLMAAAASAHAAEIKVFLGPAVSSYTGRWPTRVFQGPVGEPDGLNPFINRRTGSLQGFGLEAQLEKWLAVEIDGLYFALGSTFAGPGELFTEQMEIYDLEGLSVPVLAKFRPYGGLFPYFLAGVDVTFAFYHVRTSLVLPEDDIIYREIAREDLWLATKKFDFKPVLGMGFEITVFKQTFFVEGRYALGTVDMVKGFPGDVESARIRSFCLLLGYRM